MTRDLRGQIALVTGSSGGIGGAIAVRLAPRVGTVCLVGRNRRGLEQTAVRVPSSTASIHVVDFLDDEGIARLAEEIGSRWGGVDILVHSSGLYGRGELATASVDELDALYRSNVRVPYVVTQAFLDTIKKRSGQIVFINSTVGLAPRAGVGQFASTQHAVKALTDTLRDELNPFGVRVLSVFAGRTATPRMEKLFRMEGKTYHPELLLQPEDIATVVVDALQLPMTAEVTNISIRPLRKSY